MENMRLGGLLELSPEKFGSFIIKVIGPVLLIVLLMLISFMTFTYFTEILPFILPDTGDWLAMAITTIGLLILFNILYNYIMCVYTGPGHPPDLPELPRCKTCKGPKPPRAHHCSVCNRCVMKMDHHCPWIMNCVGFKNHRYFVLFLIYICLGCFFMASVSYTRFSTRPRNSSAHICFLLAVVFSIVLLLFAGWHVMLVFMGLTTIELFGYYGNSEEKEKYNFSRGQWRKNLEVVFGTTSFLIALMPRSEQLQFDGVEWPDTIHSI